MFSRTIDEKKSILRHIRRLSPRVILPLTPGINKHDIPTCLSWFLQHALDISFFLCGALRKTDVAESPSAKTGTRR
jgi:hypothetical protein